MKMLTHQDRCDRCGARAHMKVSIRKGTHPLLFCAHHYDCHKTALRDTGAMIQADTRKELVSA